MVLLWTLLLDRYINNLWCYSQNIVKTKANFCAMTGISWNLKHIHLSTSYLAGKQNDFRWWSMILKIKFELMVNVFKNIELFLLNEVRKLLFFIERCLHELQKRRKKIWTICLLKFKIPLGSGSSNKWRSRTESFEIYS